MGNDPVYLSSDVANAMPREARPRYKILRSHIEEIRTGLFGWKKQQVRVIDNVQLLGLDVISLDGSTWQVPLGSPTQESSQTSSEMEVSNPLSLEEQQH